MVRKGHWEEEREREMRDVIWRARGILIYG